MCHDVFIRFYTIRWPSKNSRNWFSNEMFFSSTSDSTGSLEHVGDSWVSAKPYYRWAVNVRYTLTLSLSCCGFCWPQWINAIIWILTAIFLRIIVTLIIVCLPGTCVSVTVGKVFLIQVGSIKGSAQAALDKVHFSWLRRIVEVFARVFHTF